MLTPYEPTRQSINRGVSPSLVGNHQFWRGTPPIDKQGLKNMGSTLEWDHRITGLPLRTSGHIPPNSSPRGSEGDAMAQRGPKRKNNYTPGAQANRPSAELSLVNRKHDSESDWFASGSGNALHVASGCICASELEAFQSNSTPSIHRFHGPLKRHPELPPITESQPAV